MKKNKFDTSAAALGPFGVSVGLLLRTRLGSEVRVVGVKTDAASSALGALPRLWVEHKNGMVTPLDVTSSQPLAEQGVTILSDFSHLSVDVPVLPLREVVTPRMSELPVSQAASALSLAQAVRDPPPPFTIPPLPAVDELKQMVWENKLPPPQLGTTSAADANKDPVIQSVATERVVPLK